MNKILYIFFILLIVSNCAPKKVIKNHGVIFLEKKEKLLVVNKSNKNDIVKILGTPSINKKKYNNDLIYIERKQTQSNLLNLGKENIFENNVLVLKINDKGILIKKDFYNINDMNKIKIEEEITNTKYKKNSFIYEFLSSMRQKVNDPLGQRAKKRKQIRQQ